MRLLLDTHVVLWDLTDSRELAPIAQDAIAAASELLFSVVSFAEIGVKVSVGKLTAPANLEDEVRSMGLHVLGLSPVHGLAVAHLPLHHRDPYDRLLIAQARAERLTVVTADPRFAAYGVDVIPAGC